MRLVDAQNVAKNAKIGVHAEDKKAYKQRNLVWADSKFDADAKLKSYKGKPVDVIVEHVLNGSSLRVQLPTNEMVVLHMTGVQAPTFKLEEVDKGDKKKKDEKSASSAPSTEGEGKVRAQRVEVAQPFAKEARNYTEMRLLHREVTVLLESTDKFNNFFGTIIINEDEKSKEPVTFQEALLLQGLARLAEWGAARSKYLPRLRAAENEAKKQKLRIWKDYKAPERSATADDAKEYNAKVVEIVSGDTVRIKDDNGVEERVSLSSIRAPRMGIRIPGKNEPAEAWGVEAREALRKQVAGKKVQVRVDYRKTFERPVFKTEKGTNKRVDTGEKESEERKMVSILVGGKSVAVDLVKEGFCTVIRHKSGEERSLFYDQLMLAETDAEKKGKGKHGNRKAPVHQINEVNDLGSAQKLINVLKDKQAKAVVEKVLSGTRYKLLLPQDSIVITFSLNGVTSPSVRPKESPEKPKPFAKEAIDFANDQLLFRDVVVTIDGVDKTGGFVGELSVKSDNFAVKLLENGLAMLQRSAEKLKNYSDLSEAQNKARGTDEALDENSVYPKGKNVWTVPANTFRSARQRTEKVRERAPTDRFTLLGTKDDSHQARVTCVADINKFYIQTADAEADLAHLDELMGKLNLDSQAAPTQQPELNSLVFAKFVDGQWYRARVVEPVSAKDNKLAVLYIDFGNTERVGVNDLRILNKEQEIGKIAPVAQECKLAFVYPHEEKYRQEATQSFKDMVEDRDLVAVFEYREGGVTYITIEEGEGVQSETVNETLVRDGLVFVDTGLSRQRKNTLDKKLAKLQSLQNAAKDERRYLFEDGDVYQDDDDFEY